PPPARRPDVPGGPAPAGRPADRQRPVARGRAGPGGVGREPAPGTRAVAQLQPATRPDRAVLEDPPPPSHAQPAVRHAGRPTALDPRQPELLPDHARTGPDPTQPQSQ